MGDPADKAYLQPYRQAVRRFGGGFGATLWNSREAQALRFDVMIGMAGFAGARLLDVGCGEGDLAARLIERNVPFDSYRGVDAVPEMIEAALARNLPRCTFSVGDPVTDPRALGTGADWVTLSGTLNTMDEATAERLVAACFAAAAAGVVFNFLSTAASQRWAGRDPSPARRFSPVRFLDFALSLSPRVSFTQSYLDGHDATMLIEHGLGADACRAPAAPVS